MRFARSIVYAVMLALTSAPIATAVHAQRVPSPLNETDRRAVVESAAKMLRERYVFPDIGDQAAGAIESVLGAGGYAGLDQLAQFAQRFTEDLRTVAMDKHLRITAPGAPTASPPQVRPPPRISPTSGRAK